MQLLPIVQFSSTRSYVNSEFSFLLYPLQSSSVRASIKNDQFSDHSICAILCRKMRNGRWLKEVHNNSFIYRVLSERKKKGSLSSSSSSSRPSLRCWLEALVKFLRFFSPRPSFFLRVIFTAPRYTLSQFRRIFLLANHLYRRNDVISGKSGASNIVSR